MRSLTLYSTRSFTVIGSLVNVIRQRKDRMISLKNDSAALQIGNSATAERCGSSSRYLRWHEKRIAKQYYIVTDFLENHFSNIIFCRTISSDSIDYIRMITFFLTENV